MKHLISFSYRSICQRNDLEFHTGTEKQTFEEVLLPAQLAWYEKHPISRPRTDVPLLARLLWVMTVLHRGLNFSDLYKLVSPANYSGGIDSFREFMLRSISHLRLALGESETHSIQYPSISDWRERNQGKGMEAFSRSLMFFIDRTTLPLQKPAANRRNRETYVSYKKAHGFRYFILCTADGQIVKVSNCLKGCTTDQAHYILSNLKQELELKHADAELAVGEHFALGGDKGYIHISPPSGWRLILTKSADIEATNGSDQTADDLPKGPCSFSVEYTTAMCRPRAVVERVIGRVKRPLSLGLPIGRSKDNRGEEDLVYISCVLTNLFIENLKERGLHI